jgi:hypothetical protein
VRFCANGPSDPFTGGDVSTGSGHHPVETSDRWSHAPAPWERPRGPKARHQTIRRTRAAAALPRGPACCRAGSPSGRRSTQGGHHDGPMPGPRRCGSGRRRPPALRPAAAPASGYRPTWRHGHSQSASRHRKSLRKEEAHPASLAINSATGFLADCGGNWPAERGRQETARFSGALSTPTPRDAIPSHAFCVGTLDLASVSPIVRSVSNSVRRNHPTVSANLHRKPPLIARRTVHHCARAATRRLTSYLC